jgi:hypothetical protein
MVRQTHYPASPDLVIHDIQGLLDEVPAVDEKNRRQDPWCPPGRSTAM